MEGEEQWEGRVEICYNKRWGTVGGDNWTETNSDVVCRALGYYGKSGRQPLFRYFFVVYWLTLHLLMKSNKVHIHYCFKIDQSATLKLPPALSKPLYYHSIKCSNQDMSLSECAFTRNTDLIKNYPQAVVKCQQCRCPPHKLLHILRL